MHLSPVTGRRSIHLSDDDARLAKLDKSDREIAEATKRETDRISELQQKLYADARYALLVVLQGRDASGKDATIRKVFSAVNPQGCRVATFKAPTELEQEHDFLWRVHLQVPARRMIGIFNRSHYEDVIVPRVRKQLKKKEIAKRYEQINDFERMLTENRVAILKFMLHVSHDEQKKRLEERLTDPTKNWKFRAGDLEDRHHWDDFTKAYRGALARTSTRWAPWYIVPADDKDVRNWLIARTIADTLASLHLRYPRADASVLGLKVE